MPEMSNLSGVPCQLRTQTCWATPALAAGKHQGRSRCLPQIPASRCHGSSSRPAACPGSCAHCLLCKHSGLPIPVLHLMVCKTGARGCPLQGIKSKCTFFPSYT